MKRSEEDVGWRILNILIKENEARWFGCVKRRNANSILRNKWSWKWRLEGQ